MALGGYELPQVLAKSHYGTVVCSHAGDRGFDPEGVLEGP
jgi:hypothetical protein